MATRAPSPPGDLKINGTAEKDELSTHKMHTATVSASIRDNADNHGQVRLVVYLSKTKNFSKAQVKRSGWGGNRTASVSWDDLDPNTHYYLRAHTEQRNIDQLSSSNTANFWTERPPAAPTNLSPGENVTVLNGANVILNWTYRDADRPQDAQDGWQVRWRIPADAVNPAGDWTTISGTGTDSTYTITGGRLKANTFYEWQVRNQDSHSTMWGDWTQARSFYVTGANRPPRLTFPVNGEAISVDDDVTFTWVFRDPQRQNTQVKADLQFRVAGTQDWTVLFGDLDPASTVPGPDQDWVISPPTLLPAFRYEWQVRTYDSSDPTNPSDWSESAFFHTSRTPGWAVADESLVVPSAIQGALGEGAYRVMVYDRGAQRVVGEVTPVKQLQWTRLRDDISSCTFTVNGFEADCCELLRSLRTWVHEIVLFRDGVRVWEGPITRIGYLTDGVDIEARDPMIYVYRRIMRQGYSDRFVGVRDKKTGKIISGTGPRSVVDRAAIIIQNALAPNDPNVLPYLTRFDFPDDAKQSRSVGDWQKTAWEEVDDLAANAGLDYTTVGRRIILWDTHRPIGRIAELRDKDFFTPPVITEYGMSAANIFGVSSTSGLHGQYGINPAQWGGAGPIEQLASAYGEAGDSSASSGAMTSAERADKQVRLNRQAARNLNGRWPPPLIVRVPDNSRLHPSAFIGINQLVPGVHIPLRATTACREMAQVQKLDSVTVNVDPSTGEQVQVVMSPAPGASLDPDAVGAVDGSDI